MASHYEAPIRRPLVTGEKSYHDVTLDVVAPVEGKANKLWWVVFSIALSAFGWGLGCMIYTVSTGIGTWGLNKTVGWAWDITNFVWWVGIGHAGTLISAVLLLFRQKWRMAINRSAEAMTIFSCIIGDSNVNLVFSIQTIRYNFCTRLCKHTQKTIPKKH